MHCLYNCFWFARIVRWCASLFLSQWAWPRPRFRLSRLLQTMTRLSKFTRSVDHRCLACIFSYKPARSCFVYQDGDDANEYDEDYEDVAAYTIEYADLHTSVIFPDYPNKHLPLGEEVKVLIGLDNRGSESLNVCYAFFWMPHMYVATTVPRCVGNWRRGLPSFALRHELLRSECILLEILIYGLCISFIGFFLVHGGICVHSYSWSLSTLC